MEKKPIKEEEKDLKITEKDKVSKEENKDAKNNENKKNNINEEFEAFRKQAKIVEIKIRRPSFLRTILFYIAIVFITSTIISYMGTADVKSMSYTELMQNIDSKNVVSIKMQNDKQSVKVNLKNDTTTQRLVKLPDSGAFVDFVQPKVTLNEFELTVSEPSFMESLAPLIPNIILLVGTLLIFMFMIRKSGDGNNKALSFGKNRAKLFDPNMKNKTTFENVAGLLEEKEELQEIVDFLKNPKKYKDL